MRSAFYATGFAVKGLAPVAALLMVSACAHAPSVSRHEVVVSPQSSVSIPLSTAVPRPLDVGQVVAKIEPSMVNITATMQKIGWQSSGSGFVVSPDGQIVTSYHVVRRADRINVVDVGDGITYRATMLGYDNTHDVALLQLTGARDLSTATISPTEAHIGDEIVVTGNARGAGGAPTTVSGNVLSTGQKILARNEVDGSSKVLNDLIELNADVVQGQSGGVVANRYGAVVGLVAAASAQKTPADETNSGTPPRGYAVPIRLVMDIVAKIRAHEPTSDIHISPSAILGVRVADEQSGQGARVADAIAGGPGQAVGISAGDLIVAIDDERIETAAKLRLIVNRHHPGDVVRVQWISRDGVSHDDKAVLVEGAE